MRPHYIINAAMMKNNNIESVPRVEYQTKKETRPRVLWLFASQRIDDVRLRGEGAVLTITKTLPRFTVGFITNQYKLSEAIPRGLSSQRKSELVASSSILQQLYLRDNFREANNLSRQGRSGCSADAENGPLEKDNAIITAKDGGVAKSEDGDVSQTLVAPEELDGLKVSTPLTTSANNGHSASPSEWTSPDGDKDPPSSPAVQAGTGSSNVSCSSSVSPPVGSEVASPAQTEVAEDVISETSDDAPNPLTTPVSRIIRFDFELAAAETEEEHRYEVVDAWFPGSSISQNFFMATSPDGHGHAAVANQSPDAGDADTFNEDPFFDEISAATLASPQTRRRVFARVKEHPKLIMKGPVEMQRRSQNSQSQGQVSLGFEQERSIGPRGYYWPKNDAEILKSPLNGRDITREKKRELAQERFAASIQNVSFISGSFDRDNQPTRADSGCAHASPLIVFDEPHTSTIRPANNGPIQTGTASHISGSAPLGTSTNAFESAWARWQHPTNPTFQHPPDIFSSHPSPPRPAAPRVPPGLEVRPTNIGMQAFSGFGHPLMQAGTTSNLAGAPQVGTTETQAGPFTSTRDRVQPTHRTPHVTADTNTDADTDPYRVTRMWQELQYERIAGTFYGRDRYNRVSRTARNW